MAESNQNDSTPLENASLINDSAITSPGLSGSSVQEPDSTKRAAAKRLIERYYFQLTQGCGNPACANEHCSSSGRVRNLTPNQAAAQALVLFARKAKLCKPVHENEQDSSISNGGSAMEECPESSQDGYKEEKSTLQEGVCVSPPSVKKPETSSPSFKPSVSTPSYLTEETLAKIIDTCKENSSYQLLIRTLGHVFSRRESISRSFVGPGTVASEKTKLSKEQLRSMEQDLDKDQDSQEMELEPSNSQSVSSDITVDLVSLRRSYKLLESVESSQYESPLVHALMILCETLELDLKYDNAGSDNSVLNSIVVMFELPWLGVGEYFENVLPALCCACAYLPVAKQAVLVSYWAAHCTENLLNWVQILQQLISFKVLAGDFNSDFTVNDDTTISACVKVMKMIYYVNLVASLKREAGTGCVMDESMEWDDIRDMVSAFADEGPSTRRAESKLNKRKPDPLGEALGVTGLDCRNPIVPFSEFYNEPLSDAVEMDRDFAYFTAAVESDTPRDTQRISFLNYNFILTPAAKALGLYYDNRIRMYSERRMSIFHSVMHGQPTNPYLKLKIRRDHVIDDALIGLEMVAMENPSDLKKQLVVEFEGEQGIDEGGLSKEFFQLVVDQVFNPDYAMFTFRQDTQTFWFNPTSFESDAQFTLIGIMLGLAIYNTVVLDVHFPMVLYRKLMGRKGTFDDLADWDPSLWRGLKDLLDYAGDDIEETFMQNFRISYKDVFGTTYYHELKENGASITVNKENRREFVDLYADFLLNKSVEVQFRAFRRGFSMVTDESPLAVLFRPEEIEQLVCGSRNFDFEELQNATEYDGGYTAESDIIKYFWSVVHELSTEEKRRLLEFTTGSDRVPIGGLGRLKLVIARNGADSDRLPMAHTCYNVLLLPEYASKEKLRERLLKAIDYSKGFGML